MPDADDFDVEYFRSLLKGKGPGQEPAAPAALMPEPKTARKAAKPAAAKAATRGMAKTTRTKSGKR